MAGDSLIEKWENAWDRPVPRAKYNECMAAIQGELLILGYLVHFGAATPCQMILYYRDEFTRFRPSLFSVLPIHLEESGYLRKKSRENRNICEITARGRAYYRTRMEEYRHFHREMEACLDKLD